jgi:hypothetical protein
MYTCFHVFVGDFGQDIVAKLGEMMISILQDPIVKQALTAVVIDVLNEPVVLQTATDVAVQVLNTSEVSLVSAIVDNLIDGQ